MREFLHLWVRYVGTANSATGKGLKWAVLAPAAVLGVVIFDQPVLVSLPLPAALGLPALSWPIGRVVVALAALIYVPWMGGLAWARSRGPRLWVDTQPIVDVQHSIFRLTVRNDGDHILEPNARLEWVKTADGAAYRGNAQLPATLEWTHLDPPGQPKLSRGDSWTVGLAYVGAPQVGALKGSFTFAIENYRGLSSTEDDLTFGVKVTAPGTRTQETRVFRIVSDPQAPLRWRCESA